MISLDEDWITTGAHVSGLVGTGQHELWVESDGTGDGRSTVPLRPVRRCIDVNLGHRQSPTPFPCTTSASGWVGPPKSRPSYVPALDLGLERLEHYYLPGGRRAAHQRYELRAPDFGFTSS